MVRLSLRNLLAGKLRLVLTVLSVTIGVAFVAGTFVLSDTMVKAFDQLYTGLTSGTDVVVHSRSAYDADVTTTGGQVRPLPESLVARVRSVPGVAVAEGSVSGFALIIDRHGDPLQPGGAPTFGTSIAVDRALSGAGTMRAGHVPRGPDEVVVDARTVRRAGFHLGDRVDVVFQGGRRSFRLVGVVGFGKTDSLLGATMTGFELRTAQQVLGKPGLVDEIDVRADDGVSATILRDRVQQAVPPGVVAITGEQAAADGTAAVEDALGVFTTVLLVFAGVSLLVATFVIWNTFNVLVAQRRRQVALLRSVGGTRGQVLVGVLLEATTVGVVSGALGLGAGVGLAAGIRALLEAVGVDLPTTSPAVEPRTVVLSFVVGVGVTALAALLPAWSATRVSPLEALRDAGPTEGSGGRLRHVGGWAVLGAGTAVLLACVVLGGQPRWTLVGALTTFVGIVVVGPALARALARATARGRPGGGWRLASRNVVRSSRRAAATAMALTIGLAVVTAVAVTAASLEASVSAAVRSDNRSDLVLEPAGAGTGISSSVAGLLRTAPDLRGVVRDVVELRQWSARIDGHEHRVTAVDTRGLDRVVDLGVRRGALADLRPGSVLVRTSAAQDLGVRVGDPVVVTFPETGDRTLRVAGTFDRAAVLGTSYLITLPDFDANVSSRLDAAVLLTTAPGVSGTQAKRRVEAALTDYPNVTVNTPAEITRQAQQSVDQLLGIVTALLLLAVVVAVLGIVNTLVLSVVERTRELALLRAVGGTRRQVRAVVRREAVLMSALGALTGVLLGGAVGVALARALDGDGVTTVRVPLVRLAVYVVVAVAVGVLAAIGPARRASKVDVLQALASD